MTDKPYNGSSALVKKMETLLSEKKLSTPSAVRLMLEKDLADIKADHDRDALLQELKIRQDEFESRSIGFWVYKNPKTSLTLFLALYSFAISDVREPVMKWLGDAVVLLLKAL